jgi:peptide/nickel transport system substrate-binding protein
MRHRSVALMGAAILSISMAGTAVGQSDSQMTYAQNSALIPCWHPACFQTGTQYSQYQLLFNTLVKITPDYQTYVPDLAASWEISDDATEYTFHLAEGVTWHDGEPFDADDVIFTITKAVQESKDYTGYPITSWLAIEGASDIIGTTDPLPGLEKVDDHTIKITLSEPNTQFFRNLTDPAYSIMPEHLLSDVTAAELKENHPFSTQMPIGTGPYTFVGYTPDQFVEFAANEDYFKGAPKIGRIFNRLLDPATTTATFEAGDLDLLMEANVQDRDRLGEVEGANVLEVESVASQYLQFRNDNPLVADKRVRQAILHAYDRRAVLENVFGGLGRVLWIPAPLDATLEGLNEYPYDLEKAKSLLTEADFDFDAPFVFAYATDEPGWNEIGAAVEQSLRELGITNLDVQATDGAAWVETLTKEEPAYALSLNAGGSEGLFPQWSLLFFTCDGQTRFPHYDNPEVCELYRQARSTTDEAVVKDTYEQIARILNDEVPMGWLWQMKQIHAATDRLGGGFEIYPNARESFSRIETWEVAPAG